MRTRVTASALVLIAIASTAGCTGSDPAPTTSTAPGHTQPAQTGRSVVPSASTAPSTARFVTAAQSRGVKILPLPTRYRGQNATRFDMQGIPDHLTVGQPARIAVTLYRGDLSSPAVSVKMIITSAEHSCGHPFLGVPGHAYLVSCRVTARHPGKVKVTLAQYDPTTGDVRTNSTIPVPARR